MSPQGVRWNGVDTCAQHDPCQHGGICISTDTGAACECRNLDFRGVFCEKGQSPETAPSCAPGISFTELDFVQSAQEPRSWVPCLTFRICV